jgi:hypothetical protein
VLCACLRFGWFGGALFGAKRAFLHSANALKMQDGARKIHPIDECNLNLHTELLFPMGVDILVIDARPNVRLQLFTRVSFKAVVFCLFGNTIGR